MKANLSILSKQRSFIGFEIEHGGYLQKAEDGTPTLYRTIEASIGFLFGWISLSFNYGGSIRLDDINKSLRAEVLKGKKIQ
jgi:hypothetical protein